MLKLPLRFFKYSNTKTYYNYNSTYSTGWVDNMVCLNIFGKSFKFNFKIKTKNNNMTAKRKIWYAFLIISAIALTGYINAVRYKECITKFSKNYCLLSR